MAKTWLCIKHLLAAQVVELSNKFRVSCPPLGRGNILHFVLFPKTSAITEGADTALGTHAGTGEDDDADSHKQQTLPLAPPQGRGVDTISLIFCRAFKTLLNMCNKFFW